MIGYDDINELLTGDPWEIDTKEELAVRGYVTALLWCNAVDETGESIEAQQENFDIDDFIPDDAACIREDVYAMTRTSLFVAYLEAGRSPYDFGHNFLLTRSGHGAGFWDMGLPNTLGDEFTTLAHSFGDTYVTVCSDGTLSLS